MRCAFINKKTGVVENLVEAEPGETATHLLIGSTEAHIGWRWDGAALSGDGATQPYGVRCAGALHLRYALNRLGIRAAWDAALLTVSADTRDYWATEPNPPETSPKLARIAKAAGVTVKDLFDAAMPAA